MNAFSACDEIDITFVVDDDSIIANSKGVIKFITSIQVHNCFTTQICGDLDCHLIHKLTD